MKKTPGTWQAIGLERCWGSHAFLAATVLAATACSSASPSSTGTGSGSSTPSPASTAGSGSGSGGADSGASSSSEDAGSGSSSSTPAPPPTSAPTTPPPTPPPTTGGSVGWKSVVGFAGFFGQTFNDVGWTSRSVAPGTLYSVACADNEHGWAAGEGGFVAYTADGGGTWTTQHPMIEGNLRAINFGWSTTGVVAGDAGQLAVTSDSGAHWTAVAPLTNATLRGAAVAPYLHVMLVVGDAGTVLRSGDAGATWTRIAVAGAGDFHSIASDAWAGLVLAVDSLGGIWSSADAGLTFTREMSAGVELDGISTTQAGARALAVGKGGVAFARSLEGTWSAVATGTTVDLHAALVTDGGSRFYAAGEAGTLVTSGDLGAHWTTQSLGTSAALYGLQDL